MQRRSSEEYQELYKQNRAGKSVVELSKETGIAQQTLYAQFKKVRGGTLIRSHKGPTKTVKAAKTPMTMELAPRTIQTKNVVILIANPTNLKSLLAELL